MSVEGTSRKGRVAIQARPRQTDFSYNATLAFPLFRLLGGMGELMEAAFRRLSPFGLKPGDTRLDPPWAPPTDFVLVCTLFDVGVIVRYKLAEIEIWTRNVEFVRGPNAIPLIQAALGAVEDIMGDASTIAAHGITAAAHVALHETNVVALLRRHASSDLGRLIPTMELEPFGISLQGKDVPDDARLTVDIQRSLLFPAEDSAFLRAMFACSGAMPVAAAGKRFAALLQSLLFGLGIELRT